MTEPASNGTSRGRVSFIGAGPGAADLITVRAAKRLAEADIVVWAASLVTLDCVRDHASPDAELVDSSRITHEDVIDIYRRALRDRLKVARVHSGDPALWGAVQEQYDACQRMDLDVEIVPGVSAFSAAAAAIGRELTVPEVAQSVVLTRLEGGKTPMPERERIRDFAKHGTTMAIFLSAARAGQLAEELREGGYAEDTPIVVAYKVTWPDELILHTTLGELESAVKEHKLWRHTLFLVGQALRSGGTRSRLYHAGHFHTYRKADKAARRALRSSTRPKATPPSDIAAVPSPAPEPEAKSAGAGPNAETAWWAVRNWQETARTAPRATAKSRPAKTSAQDGLFDGGTETAEQPATAPQPDPESAPAAGAAAAAAPAPARVTARVTPRADDATPPDSAPSPAAAPESAAPMQAVKATSTTEADAPETESPQQLPSTPDPETKSETKSETKTETKSDPEPEPAKPTPAKAKSTRGGTAKSKPSTRKTGLTRNKRRPSGTS